MIEKQHSDPSRDIHHVIQQTSPHARPRSVRFIPSLALSAVVVACLGLFSQEASAFALGRVAVQSALGEVLSAEIDIPDINTDEAASLRVSIGSVEAFRRAGLEYNSAVSGLRVTVQRRPDGRAYLRLSSDRIINEPFLDLIIEANWAAGQLTRDYTLLFDPPVTRQALPTPTAPQISSAIAPRAARLPAQNTAVQESAATSAPASTAPAPAARAPVNVASRRLRTKPTEKPTPVAEQTGQQITVRPGDTASKIASTLKPSSISLDQMLIALLQANPNAFTGANVNRLKAGVVLEVPGSQAASTTPANEASQMVLAQSRDFNDFRRKLANGSAVAPVDAGKRTSSGKVQASIEDKKASSALPDKLSLHKGEILGKTNQDALAKALQAKEAANRLAELNKNVSELQKLSADAAKQASSAPSPVKAASAPGLAVVTPKTVAEPITPPLSVPASAPVSLPVTTPTVATATATVDTPALPASTPPVATTQPSATKTVAVPAIPASAAASSPAATGTQAESSFLTDLMENPWVAPAAGGLVALLVGLGLYRVRQRKKTGQIDSNFTESRLQPDSFFGTSGGGKIDTNESAMAASSMMYSPSQLDAGADVDPVAEADVYLAYGRDLQAEEILKEALRVNPARAAIHFKLLQIYAKRRDILNFAATAAEAQKLTQGVGSEWAQACEVGRELDPPNPLYHGGGASTSGSSNLQPTAPEAAPDSTFSSTNIFPHSQTDQHENDLNKQGGNVDLDLDFFDATPTSPTASDTAKAAEPAGLPDLNFELDTSPPIASPAPFASAEQHDGIEFTTDDLSALNDAPPAVTPTLNLQTVEFDLDSLSLDLDAPTSKSGYKEPVLSGFGDAEESSLGQLDEAEDDDDNGGDPLITKLALAEEFQAIGDDDGARTLAQEVADEATGSLKAKAEQFLAALG